MMNGDLGSPASAKVDLAEGILDVGPALHGLVFLLDDVDGQREGRRALGAPQHTDRLLLPIEALVEAPQKAATSQLGRWGMKPFSSSAAGTRGYSYTR